MKKSIPLMTMLFVVSACAQDIQPQAQNQAPQSSMPPPPTKEQQMADQRKLITVKGTLFYKPMEGGFYGFDAENGAKYMPRNLEKSYLKHGYVLEIQGVTRPDILTFQQYGEVLEVKSVKVIAEPKTPEPDAY